MVASPTGVSWAKEPRRSVSLDVAVALEAVDHPVRPLLVVDQASSDIRSRWSGSGPGGSDLEVRHAEPVARSAWRANTPA